MPVVARRLLDLLVPRIGDAIQRIPVEVESTDEEYEILNVLEMVDCVDEERSEFTKWGKNDGRPDKLGQYRSIPMLRIDPTKAAGHKMFRIKGWDVGLIVDDEIKNLLEKAGITGVIFRDVS